MIFSIGNFTFSRDNSLQKIIEYLVDYYIKNLYTGCQMKEKIYWCGPLRTLYNIKTTGWMRRMCSCIPLHIFFELIFKLSYPVVIMLILGTFENFINSCLIHPLWIEVSQFSLDPIIERQIEDTSHYTE